VLGLPAVAAGQQRVSALVRRATANPRLPLPPGA
jgi:hypothetical protein